MSVAKLTEPVLPEFSEQAGSRDLVRYGKHRFQRIIKILTNFAPEFPFSRASLLDDGCGYGYSSAEFSNHVGKVTGIDVNSKAIKNAKNFAKIHNLKNTSFQTAKGENLPFKENNFDIVVSYQVIQYVDENQKQKYLNEAFRVLKKNSLFYFAAPNYWFPIEPHFRIPALQFLPGFVSNRIAKLFGMNSYSIKMLSYGRAKNMLEQAGFKPVDYTKEIISNPEKHGLKKDLPFLFTLAKLFPFLAKLSFLSPSYVFICKKD